MWVKQGELGAVAELSQGKVGLGGVPLGMGVSWRKNEFGFPGDTR